MGSGTYSSADWSKLKTSRSITCASSENEIFAKTFNDKYDPRFIAVRESRDSDEHPFSTPIILGLDDTASMGYLSQKIATESLHETMMKLYSTNAVPDPQLMFAFYGDKLDDHPLQVTQFESDIRIAEQLMELRFENRGQCHVINNLLWYFADKHTSIDSWEKRRKKGFIITLGDDATVRSAVAVNKVGDNSDAVISTENIIASVGKKYELFHIIVEGRECTWNYLPGRVIAIDKDKDIDALPEIIISVIQYTLGKEIKDILSQWDASKRDTVRYALGCLDLKE